MKKHLKYIDGNSDKFWQIEASGLQYIVTYGKNGTGGVTQTKSFTSNEDCIKAAEKLIAEKIKKGYSENGVVVSTQQKSTGSKDIQSILNEYDEIIKAKRQDLLLPFLKQYSKGNLDALKKQIKKNKRYWMTFVELKDDPEYKTKSNSVWGTRGDKEHIEIITLSAIALFNAADTVSWDEIFNILNDIQVSNRLEIVIYAKPKWIGSYLLDRIKKQEWQALNYKTLRFLEEQSLLTHYPELYAQGLARHSEWHTKIKERDFIDYIINDVTAYKRDVPELFNYETNFHNCFFRDNESQPYNAFSSWGIIFGELLRQEKMDRSFFIENAILIQTKDWNNNLKSFLRKQLVEIKCTADDLMPFQENIFACLHNPFPPVTNYGIELVKKMYNHPGFNSVSFVQWVEPLMMRSDCKAAIKGTLLVLEKLNKIQPKLNGSIVQAISEVFLIEDLGLQERAAKVLNKIISKKDNAIKEKLTSYVSLMQGNIKTVLAEFIDDEVLVADTGNQSKEYVFSRKPENLLSQEVELPQDWNEILYLFGSFIASEDVSDTEKLINVYLTQRHLFPKDYSKQLQPYAKQLEGKYFESINKNYTSVFLQQKIHDINFPFRIKDSEYDKVNTLLLIKQVLYAAQDKISNKSISPLLSFPTHLPHWIDPVVLVKRLVKCQQDNEKINWVDLSIAISRMPRENIENAIPLLNDLKGELRHLMSFCLGVSKDIILNSGSIFNKLLSKLGAPANPENIGVWSVASRTFYPDETFEIFNTTYLKGIPFAVSPFNPKIKLVERWNEWKDYQTKELQRSPSWYEIGFDAPPAKKVPHHLLYSQDFGPKRNHWGYTLNNVGNVYYWASLTPQNIDALAVHLLQTSCITADGAKHELKGFMDLIGKAETGMSDIVMTVYACCFFIDKKDVRMYASETLINLVENCSVDIGLLAEKLSFLAVSKYGAFVRMADCLIALKDVSPLHNKVLQQIIDDIIVKIATVEKLPVNFKKLVESYVDLMYKTGMLPSAELTSALYKWKENSSLKPLIKQIIK